MSEISQTVRNLSYNPARTDNPSGLTNDILALHAALSGSGAPDPSLGKIGDTYFDLLTTYNYQKNLSGVWEPTYSISASLPPAPPAVIPDPLPVGELQTDTIKGKTSDSLNIDAGLNGDINMTVGATNLLNVGPGNLTIQGNGVITGYSPANIYEVSSDNFTGKQITLSAPTDSIKLIGPDPYTIEAVNLGTSLTVKANDADLVLNAGTSKIKVASSNLANTTANSFIIEHETPGEDVEIKAEGTGAGNVVLRPGAGGGVVQTVENLSLQGNFLVDVGNIQHTTGSIFTIENTSNNQDVLIRTTGSGQLRLNSGSSEVKVESPATFTPFGFNTSAINASQTYTTAKSLLVNHSGVLTWSEPPETVIWTGTNIGVNGTTYLNVAGLAVNPADVPVYSVLAPNMFVRRIEANLIYSTPWSWGGGTATLEFGLISSGLPCTDANWVPAFNIPMTTTGDYYFSLSLPNVNIGAGGGKLACRIVASGTAPTAAQAELTLKLILSS